MYDQLDLVGSRPLLLLSDLSSEGGSFNGYALSQLGFQFGTSAMLSSSFYVELAFLQVGGGVGGKVCGGLREEECTLYTLHLVGDSVGDCIGGHREGDWHLIRGVGPPAGA